MAYFTICIPVYSRKDTIIRTLSSIMTQNFQSYEVIIVDDGSTDGTDIVVKQYLDEKEDDRYIYIYKENGGKHSALNVGIRNATGKFFLILDSDDWFVENALNSLYSHCVEIENDDTCCGIMGRTINSDTGEIIGDLFDLNNPVSSYFEYHFILPQKMYVQDCYEAVKVSILKQYSYPEQKGMRFVPEAYIFDKIGIKYTLILTNDVFRITEYREDGMTLDKDFKKKNVVGYLYHYISRIEDVIIPRKMPAFLKIKLLILSWWRYWQCVNIDTKQQGPRIERITIMGHIVRIVTPIINKIFEKKYPQYVR